MSNGAEVIVMDCDVRCRLGDDREKGTSEAGDDDGNGGSGLIRVVPLGNDNPKTGLQI